MRWTVPVSRNGRLWNIRAFPASVRLAAGEPHHLAPFLGFVGDELAEVGGRARKRERGSPSLGKAAFHGWPRASTRAFSLPMTCPSRFLARGSYPAERKAITAAQRRPSRWAARPPRARRRRRCRRALPTWQDI